MKHATISLLISLVLIFLFSQPADAKKKKDLGAGTTCTTPREPGKPCICFDGTNQFRCENCDNPDSECDDITPPPPPPAFRSWAIIAGSIIVAGGIYFGLRAKGRGTKV